MDSKVSYAKIPLLEDIETPVVEADDDGYPVKPSSEPTSWWAKKKKRCCEKGKKCRGRRCLKKILKLAFLLFAIFSVVALVGSIRAYKRMAREVKHWTVTEPHLLPRVDPTPEETELFKSRAKLFWDTIQAGKIPEDFIATAADLNGLAADSDFLRGNAYAELSENQVKISVSLPADFLPGGKGRFLVGTEIITWDPEHSLLRLKMDPMDETLETFYDITFALTKEDDQLNLQVVSGQVLEWIIPEEFIEEHNNLLEDLYDCHCKHDKGCMRTRKFLEGLAEVSLEKDQVVVHPSPDPPADMAFLEKTDQYHMRHGRHGHHGGDGHHHGHHHWKKSLVHHLFH